MTLRANQKRNAEVIALFFLGIPPKQIPHELRAKYPDLTVKIVYKVTGKKGRAKFHAEQGGEIWGNSRVAETNSHA